MCKKQEINVSVYYAYRTKEEQYALYLQGRASLEEVNKARAQVGLPLIKESENRIVTTLLDSAHNHGLAADFVPVVNGKAIWDDYELWNKCGEIALSLGLEWGGTWKDFPDYSHLQMEDWRKYVKQSERF
uniref:M15 family peptidase n=1 Tax=Fervidobacterium pennivorans TaxID=93466 RepID=A0A7V4NGE6_FERPE